MTSPRFKAKSIATQQPDELQLQFAISRTGAVSFFGLAIYSAMLVMMVCALTISSLVFLGVRRIEVTLIGVLGAMIFALPARCATHCRAHDLWASAPTYSSFSGLNSEPSSRFVCSSQPGRVRAHDPKTTYAGRAGNTTGISK
ncbi:MAG: hypothetical protein WAN64_13925 [Pseudolabrys sp.]